MNINVLKFGGTSMNDHQTWKRVLDIIRSYEYPVVVVSATARTTRKLLEAGKLAAGGDLTGAKKIAEEIYDRHYELVKNFLDENPHKKNQLILESCDKKLDEKTGLLKKYLDYTAKTGSLEPKMSDAIASIGE